jgi:hypothetical protein
MHENQTKARLISEHEPTMSATCQLLSNIAIFAPDNHAMSAPSRRHVLVITIFATCLLRDIVRHRLAKKPIPLVLPLNQGHV